MRSKRLKIQFHRDATKTALIVTAGLVFLLIVLGILMRASGTGHGCPDWPTCLGSWTLPQQQVAFLPYIHRAAAGLAGLALLYSLWIAWRTHRKEAWVVRPLLVAVGLTAAQVFVGALYTLRAGWLGLSSVHLGLAFLTLSCVMLAAISLYRKEFTGDFSWSFNSRFGTLVLVLSGLAALLLVSGSILSAGSSAELCSGWPLCQTFPDSPLGWLHYSHRLFAGLALVLTAWLLVSAWRSQRSKPLILVAATATGVLFFAQAAMGPVEAARGYPAYLSGLHAATASGVWAALSALVISTGFAARTTAEEAQEAAEAVRRKGLAKDFLLLTKPIVVLLLLVTTIAGMVVGAEAWPSLSLAFWTLLGGAMAAGGSGAINQYIDRADDIRMQRTQKRPIPSGRLTPGEGLAFGVALCLGSFYVLAAQVNLLAAVLSLAGIFYYVVLYSLILKKTTTQNIVIGGGAGAIPPLVGWAAATGSLNIPALFLFAVIFMWTPPHFWALALVRRKDYARAGVPMLPVVRGEQDTRRQIFIYTLELVGLTLVLPFIGLGGSIYLVSAAVLGAALIVAAYRVWKGSGNKVAWMMYRQSSMYLAFLFVALMVDALL